MNYAVRITNDIASQIIVGTADWATENLGGTWIDSADKVGIGWLWDGTTFTPPPTPDVPIQ